MFLSFLVDSGIGAVVGQMDGRIFGGGRGVLFSSCNPLAWIVLKLFEGELEKRREITKGALRAGQAEGRRYMYL